MDGLLGTQEVAYNHPIELVEKEQGFLSERHFTPTHPPPPAVPMLCLPAALRLP